MCIHNIVGRPKQNYVAIYTLVFMFGNRPTDKLALTSKNACRKQTNLDFMRQVQKIGLLEQISKSD